MEKRGRHFGSLTEHAIPTVERCEDGYPKSPLSTQRRFRINRLTSNVPYAVRYVLLATLRELKVAE
ncbi:MAG: hypothetical protein II604_07350 [Bacteroidales bacterium]|nr:hypothetical protein [Bacteroidales bacterium]